MKPPLPTRRASQRGLTLVELMVGLLLGLIASLIITQVFAAAEGYKRSATSGSDAQVNGALALFSLQRDIQMAGYGLAANPNALGCQVKGTFSGTDLTPFPLAPVVITPGATASAPDTVTVLSSAASMSSVPIKVTAVHPANGNFFTVDSSLGVSNGDLLVAVPATWNATNTCSLLAVASDSTSGALTATNIPHASSNGWNGNVSSVFPTGGYPDSSSLINLGAMVRHVYSISSAQNLQQGSMNSSGAGTTTLDAFPQIVRLRALYGKDTDGNGQVDRYENTAPVTATDWSRVKSIRIAIVARSTQREKDVVTPAALNWDLGSVVSVGGSVACPGGGSDWCLSLTPSGTDWQHYRYKIFETIIPLRNSVWHL